ncbi:MAG: ABC transporter ATP-binding protein [Mobilitalea sp.]
MKFSRKKSSDALSNLKFIFHYTYQWQKSIFVSIGLYSVFYSLSPFIWIYVPKFLIDELTNEQRIQRILLILVLTFLVASIVEFMTEFLQGNFKMKMNAVRYRFIEMLSKKTMVMDYQYTEDPQALNEIDIALKVIQNPRSGIGFIILKMLSLPGSIIGFFAFSLIIFRLNWMLLLFLMLTMLLSYLLILRSNNYERSRKDDLSSVQRKSWYSSRILADFQYGKDIRAYRLDKLLLSKKQRYSGEILKITSDIQSNKLKNSIWDSILMLLRELIIYSYLIYQMLFANMTIGEFVMYLAAIKTFITWTETTMGDVAIVYTQSLYVQDFRDFLNKKEPYNNPHPINVPESETYEIEFDKVSFQYPGSNRYIFKNFSLTIKAGEKLAIVGINGAGKTTLVKLLTRLYQPTEGKILINGIDINDMDRKEYTELITAVFQDIKLFAFNIKENITFEEDTSSEDRLRKVIDLAGLSDKISTLDKGVLTGIYKIFDKNGIELSGGENQKLALARALYKGGKIIVMDEPTAALDALAEYKLYKSFDELIGNKTSIYISHRLSSTRFCDQIAFIENGELKEYGTHEELMQKGMLYAEMFQVQSQYYQEELYA